MPHASIRLSALLLCLSAAWACDLRGQVALDFGRLLYAESRTLTDQYAAALSKLEAELARSGDYREASQVKARLLQLEQMGRVLGSGQEVVSQPSAASAPVDLKDWEENYRLALQRDLAQKQIPLLKGRLQRLKDESAGNPAAQDLRSAQIRHVQSLLAAVDSDALGVLSGVANHWSAPAASQVLKGVRWLGVGEDAAHLNIRWDEQARSLELAWVHCPSPLASEAGSTEFARLFGVSAKREQDLAQTAAQWVGEHVAEQDLRVVLLQPQETTEHARCLVQVAGLGWLQEALVARGLALLAEPTPAESADLLLRSWFQWLNRAQDFARQNKRGVWSFLSEEGSP